MKYLHSLFLCLVTFNCAAQQDATLATRYFKEAEQAANGQQLWPVKLYGPTLLVDPNTRVTYANEPDSGGLLKPVQGIYTGILPKEVMVANTAINWQGKRWAVLLWPLPADPEERLNIFLHESFHRVQLSLNIPDANPTASHLADVNGRIYFLLELHALKAALAKPVGERKDDITNALRFRLKRKELFPESFHDEELLELNEGMAEATGLILGRKSGHILKHLNALIDNAPGRSSLIRSSAYLTGAVYGYLLYERDQRWTRFVNANTTFSSITEQVYGIKPVQDTRSVIARLRSPKYNASEIVKAETEKHKQTKLLVKAYTDKFTGKPLLKVRLVKININYNPNNLFDLGGLGTVYPTVEISDTWGRLTVTDGGMLMKDWQLATLSMQGYTQPEPRKIKGNGWEIQLNEGWAISEKEPGIFEIIFKS